MKGLNSLKANERPAVDPVESYELACESNELRKEWIDAYNSDPTSFFEEESIKNLKQIDIGKRMLWFSLCIRDLRVTPDIVKKYFEEFPQDLDAFKDYVQFNGSPENNREFVLWSMCAGFRNEPEESVRRDQYKEIFERRKLAAKHLLPNYTFDIFEKMGDFGEAADGFLETFDEAGANPMGLDTVLDTSKMFSGQKYLDLPPKDKILFLQKCLAALQYCLVFHETNNSAFRAQNTGQAREKSLHHNVAHSMLFETFQPSIAYNLNQQYFDYEMDSTAATGGFVEEYPFHRMIIATLKEIKKTKDESFGTTDLLVDFWDKNRNPIFANVVTDALVAQDVNRGASKLLEKIRGSSANKNALTAILYRLEFGRLGISKGGVKYLEKIYDLGELNNPDFFVSRLTAQGDIGIFDKKSELVNYFKLGDLSSDEEVVKAAVYDFVYDTLFIAPADETPTMKAEREKYLAEFKQNYFDFQDEEIFKEGEFHLNNLSFKEQGWLFVLWHNSGDTEKKRLLEFVKEFNEDGIKLLLLLNDKGPKFKEEIFELTKKFDKASVVTIFSKISTILSQLNIADEWLLKSKDEPKPTSVDDATYTDKYAQWRKAKRVSDSGLIQKIQRKMLERVHKLLMDDNAQGILKNLSNVSAEAILMQSMILSNREETGFSINDLPDMALYTGENYTIHDEEAKRIREIYKANYANRPMMLAKLLEGFEESRKKDNAEFHTLYFKDELVGLAVFEYDGDQVYFGKFNIDPKFQGGKIGEQMMEETLDRIAERHIVTATCSKGAPITPKYIEKGFVAEGEFDFDEDKSFNIVRNDSKNYLFTSKSYDGDFILNHAQFDSWADCGGKNCKVLLTRGENMGERMFPMLLTKEDGKRWVMTRFFKVPSPDMPMVCYVVEEVKERDFEDYKNKIDQSKPSAFVF